jgi:hypothetical protein
MKEKDSDVRKRRQLTPEEKHSGQADSILKARAERRRQARVKRIEFNRNQNCLHQDSYRQVDQIEWSKAA